MSDNSNEQWEKSMNFVTIDKRLEIDAEFDDNGTNKGLRLTHSEGDEPDVVRKARIDRCLELTEKIPDLLECCRSKLEHLCEHVKMRTESAQGGASVPRNEFINDKNYISGMLTTELSAIVKALQILNYKTDIAHHVVEWRFAEEYQDLLDHIKKQEEKIKAFQAQSRKEMNKIGEFYLQKEKEQEEAKGRQQQGYRKEENTDILTSA